VSRLIVALLTIPVTALAAPALKDRPSKGPPPIVGEWVRVGHTQGGTPVAPDAQPHHQVFKADGAWEYSYGGGASPAGMSYATDPKRTPPTIDIRMNAANPPTWRGIYKVEGDTLTLYLATGTADRPTKFESSADHPTTMWVFKRVQGKD
jgi:uncharacterized protein (TIGR03067 family)